jgi:tetratricopeptide (TPR) repeat protein
VNLNRTKLVGVGLVVFAGALWLHWPSLQGGYLAGDDEGYLRQAEQCHGLTWGAVKWAFTSVEHYYHPLPRLSHVLDYQIWGTNAAGHHASSVVVHALNAALVFGFLWTLLGTASLTTVERLMMALGGAGVFAIHPLQAESVAWMSGRTQLLCATFGIGSVWAYVAGARRWVVWMLYAAALLCKPMAVSLPFVMLAIDYFPLRRHGQFGWGRLLREKIVLIALAVAVGALTMVTEWHIRNLAPLETVPLSQRVLTMFQSLAFYPWKLVWPVPLSPYYPLGSGLSPDRWRILVSVLSVGIITGLAVWGRRRLPALAAGWGAYVMLVLPVSGLTQTGGQAVAPRYAYVAMLPLLLLAGGSAVWLWRRSATVIHLALVGLLAGELCLFGARTRSLTPDWRSDEMLSRAVLAQFPDSEEVNRELATELLDHGRASEALEYAQRGVEIAPRDCAARVMLGSVLCQLGRLQEAIGQDEQAVQINPHSARAHLVFGVALAQMGNPEEATRHYEEALRLDPGLVEAHIRLGDILSARGEIQDAIARYKEALRLQPDNAVAHHNLGFALYQVGRVQEAIQEFEVALRTKPDFAEAHYNLGIALAHAGRKREAMGHWEQALRLKPDYAKAHYNLGLALENLGRTTEAIEHYEQVLRLRPDFTAASNALARLRAGR